MTLYVSLFENSGIISIDRYRAGEQGAEGSVMRAEVSISGQRLICIDSPVSHDFSFNPSISLFVDFDDEAALDHVFDRLSDGGTVLMPLENYGFSKKYGWVSDHFGVSWQLNLP